MAVKRYPPTNCVFPCCFLRLSSTTSSTSTLVETNFNLQFGGVTSSLNSFNEISFSEVPIQWLNPANLRAKHPLLKAIKIFINPPDIESPSSTNDDAVAGLFIYIEKCLKSLVGSGLRGLPECNLSPIAYNPEVGRPNLKVI
ncbi:hypothetical protein CPB83DRAFT_691071 [Crepidotus variabilis]|uniref:Uncharacterized protein n=1 Tax=Crepidotus variabilis TaxID=179855 RepID=A0A9P6JK11_9AGAR|nr:hypothetical protein CPB83DRAFT_691071 [Crepidotus variabilis]